MSVHMNRSRHARDEAVLYMFSRPARLSGVGGREQDDDDDDDDDEGHGGIPC